MFVSNLISLPIKTSLLLNKNNTFLERLSALLGTDKQTAEDLETLDRSRNDAINLSNKISATSPEHLSNRHLTECLQKYKLYYLQLSNALKFLPPYEVTFSWSTTMKKHKDVRHINSLSYEIINLLFNFGSLYNLLSLCENRSTVEGLRTCGVYNKKAASCFLYLREQFNITEDLIDKDNNPKANFSLSTITEMQALNEDLEQDAYNLFYNISLAHVQECFWQKAVLDNNSPRLICQLLMQLIEYYSEAYNYASHKTLNKLVTDAMAAHLYVKSIHFRCSRLYRLSQINLKLNKYGNELAFLREAKKQITHVLNDQKRKLVSDDLNHDLSGLNAAINRHLDAAEKDNDLIYNEEVPLVEDIDNERTKRSVFENCLPEEIKDPKRAPSSLENTKILLFKHCLPYSIHKTISIYEKKRSDYINDRILKPAEEIENTMKSVFDNEAEIKKLYNIITGNEDIQLPRILQREIALVNSKGGYKALEEAYISCKNTKRELIKRFNNYSILLQNLMLKTDNHKDLNEYKTKCSQKIDAANTKDRAIFLCIESHLEKLKLIASGEDFVKKYINKNNTNNEIIESEYRNALQIIENAKTKYVQIKSIKYKTEVQVAQDDIKDHLRKKILEYVKLKNLNFEESHKEISVDLDQLDPFYHNNLKAYQHIADLIYTFNNATQELERLGEIKKQLITYYNDQGIKEFRNIQTDSLIETCEKFDDLIQAIRGTFRFYEAISSKIQVNFIDEIKKRTQLDKKNESVNESPQIIETNKPHPISQYSRNSNQTEDETRSVVNNKTTASLKKGVSEPNPSFSHWNPSIEIKYNTTRVDYTESPKDKSWDPTMPIKYK